MQIDIGFNAVPPPPQLLFIAHLAQKVERWPFKPMVVGSIPTVGGRPVCILRGNRYNLQQLSDWLVIHTSSTQDKIIYENILDLAMLSKFECCYAYKARVFCIAYTVRSYLGGPTGSHPNSAVKHQWACLVLRWGTTRES